MASPKVQARMNARLLRVLDLLKENGPMTTEDLSRRLNREDGERTVTPGAVRKMCADAVVRKQLRSRIVKTTRYRNGIAIWHHNDESPAKIEAAIAEVQGRKENDFRYGGYASTPACIKHVARDCRCARCAKPPAAESAPASR